jgi:hypothetical protein
VDSSRFSSGQALTRLRPPSALRALPCTMRSRIPHLHHVLAKKVEFGLDVSLKGGAVAFILKQLEDGTPVAEICRRAGIRKVASFTWSKEDQ